MACVLRVSGPKPVLDQFWARSKIARLVTWHVPKSRRTLNSTRTSAINIEVSDAAMSSFSRQLGDAIGCLADHRLEIRRLTTLPSVEATLDFAVGSRGDLASQAETFPVEIIRSCAALRLAIQISHYTVK